MAVVEQMDHRCHQPAFRQQRDAQKHISHLPDAGIGQHAFQITLQNGRVRRGEHRQNRKRVKKKIKRWHFGQKTQAERR